MYRLPTTGTRRCLPRRKRSSRSFALSELRANYPLEPTAATFKEFQ
jgi:hypothetical protein